MRTGGYSLYVKGQAMDYLIGKRVRTDKIWFAVVAMLIGSSLMTCAVAANSDNVSVRPEVITFLLGESTIVKAPWPTVRVAVTDPLIANVQVLTQDQVLLQGLKVGSTDLILWSEDETKVQQWKVQVRLDSLSLKAQLAELFPDASLEVSQSGEAFIVTGLFRRAEQITQLHELLDAGGVAYVDMTSLAGVQQVQLEVRVAEVSRVALRAMGISYFHTDDDWFGGMRGVSSTGATNNSIDIGVPSGTGAGGVTPFEFLTATSAGTATLFAGFPRADFEFFLQALIENQAVRLLANPTLVALSGEQASFLVGGEYPIPVVQGGSGGGGNSVTIQYKEYGVRLSFEPVVLGDGTIRLHAVPEVSSLSSTGAVTIQGFEVPSLLTRRSETTLELKNGQTFAMAGLLMHENHATNSRIPGLGDLPILGPLFRSVRYQKAETELVILVTASLVEPMSLASTPPLPGFQHSEPNDWEFYLEGRIESKEPAKIDANHAKWLEEMGLNQLVGPGAWDSYNKPVSPSRAGLPSNRQAENALDTSTPTPQMEAEKQE
jgi:pilus assembly protein CpaC